jgi:hypothetical protein
MGSMKTVSTMLNLLSIIVLMIYTYYLLSFINATGFLWVLWALSMFMAVATGLIGIWARDEYYAEQFKNVIEKLAKEA